jgi:tetratricopeptide (TPR) repeat protein
MSDEKKRFRALIVFLFGFLIGLLLMIVIPRFMGGERTDILKAEEMLDRRQLEEAGTWLSRLIERDSSDVEAWMLLGRLYEERGELDSAHAAYRRVVALNPESDTAIVRGFGILLAMAEGDPEGMREAKDKVLCQADAYRKELEDRERGLSLAYEGYRVAEADSVSVQALEDSLVERFPDGEKGHGIIVGRLYEGLYPVWYQESLKVEFLEEFIETTKGTEWRLLAHRYLLAALTRLKRNDELLQVGIRLLREESLNPLVLNLVASAFLRTGIEPETALDAAKRASALAPGFERPTHMPEAQWALERKVLHGDSRFLQAWALIELDRPGPAESLAREAIESTGYGADDERTYGPYFTVRGEALEALDRQNEARIAYAEALIEGDVRNRWTPRADSALARLLRPDSISALDWARDAFNYQGPVFREVTDEVGLTGLNQARVAFGDYDNDGYDDVLLNGTILLRNVRGERFEDVTRSAGIEGAEGRGGLFADFDGDGLLDVLRISSGGGESGERLFRNLGDGTFRDVTTISGVENDVPTEGAAFADVDLDGDLDLYLANYESRTDDLYHPDQLFLNEGDGTFRENASGIGPVLSSAEPRAGRGAIFSDFDHDGDPDLFVSNYRLHPDFLFRNLGDGTFEERAHLLGVAGEEIRGYYGHTIGADFGDYDGDGDLDLIAANLAHPRYIEFSDRTMLYENLGPPLWRFEDRRAEAGIQYDECHSDPVFEDFDRDGDLDLYITSIYENRGSHLYVNRGGGTFYDATWLSGTRAFNAWGCATSDYDRDGDLDLLVGSGSGIHLFENQGGGGHWLKVRAVGSGCNPFGIGCRVEVRSGKRSQVREIRAGRGTTSGCPPTAFFGLGEDDRPVSVRVRFPSGVDRLLENIPPDQLLIVGETGQEL